MIVGELVALFKVNTDRRSFARAQSSLGSLSRMALTLGTALGVRSLWKGMIGFNSTIEDSKNQIAGMLALAKKTDLSSEVSNANRLYDGLREKAAELPGQTEDYVNMLGYIVQPLARANTSIEDMQMMTVNAMVAARGLKEPWAAAARDISEFVSVGRYNTTDKFLRRLLEPMGYVGEEGRERAKAMSLDQRRDLIKTALSQKQIGQLAEAQANSYSGRVDKLKDSLKVFLGQVGQPLFIALGEAIKGATEWMKEHKDAVDAAAKSIGEGLATAFGIVGDGIAFLMDHGDATIAVLGGIAAAFFAIKVQAAFAWAAAMGPVLPLVAALSGAIYVFRKLRDEIGTVGAALAAAFAATGIWKLIDGIKQAVKWLVVMRGLSAGGLAGAATATAGGVAANAGTGAAAAGATGATAGRGGGLMRALKWAGPLALGAYIVDNALEDDAYLEANGIDRRKRAWEAFGQTAVGSEINKGWGSIFSGIDGGEAQEGGWWTNAMATARGGGASPTPIQQTSITVGAPQITIEGVKDADEAIEKIRGAFGEEFANMLRQTHADLAPNAGVR